MQKIHISTKKAAPSAYEIEIIPGVVFTVKPWEHVATILGRSAASRAIQASGLSFEDEQCRRERQAIGSVAFNIAVARWAVTAWTGIGGEAPPEGSAAPDDPLPCTPDNVEAALTDPDQWDLYREFEDKYINPNMLGLVEKNALKPSLSGTSGAKTRAKTSAKTARTTKKTP